MCCCLQKESFIWGVCNFLFFFIARIMNCRNYDQNSSHGIHIVYMLFGISFLGIRYVFVSVNVCVYVGEGLPRSFATPNPFALTNKKNKPIEQVSFLIRERQWSNVNNY